ncbi:hypothetical protein DFS34DRAFT_613691 [Phlyctochytrium arcticum]|nr:hypothetical protein DFS34DRAFT_613691 [Phlyctochytrium arcticum]
MLGKVLILVSSTSSLGSSITKGRLRSSKPGPNIYDDCSHRTTVWKGQAGLLAVYPVHCSLRVWRSSFFNGNQLLHQSTHHMVTTGGITVLPLRMVIKAQQRPKTA